MGIWSEFRMRQYRDYDYRKDAPHFTICFERVGICSSGETRTRSLPFGNFEIARYRAGT